MSIPSIVLVSKNIIPSETVKIHQKFSKDLFTDNIKDESPSCHSK